MKQISISETVLFYDTDCGGVVSNIAYLRFVERARSALFAELGMDLMSMNESQLFPVVIRTEIDYRFPARLGDEVKITATLVEVQKARVTCEFSLVVAQESGEAKQIAQAKQFVALVQMPSGRPRRTPEEWRSYT
ncbi:MAG: thioesterase family protein [Verrucomicrobiales bacterium]|jgi:YbgC/YbaW family acyl-CoA thioester hydrolase|nr:thioesterase family protein [Verrucomicrobiales bacterium]